MGTVIDIVDNSGARRMKVIQALGGRPRRPGGIGDLVVGSVLETRHAEGKVRKGDVRRALIIRTKKGLARPNGHRIKFLQNSAVVRDYNSRDHTSSPRHQLRHHVIVAPRDSPVCVS